jgi:Interferon-induced transmembrane protein/zinc-ribbon domain
VFCPNCGANNPETAAICPQCNQPIPQFGSTPQPVPVQPPPPAPLGVPAAPAVPGAPPPRIADVPNYLVQSIVMTVFSFFGLCCLFGILALPFAIIALVYSTQVNSKLGMNDIVGAQAASKNAKLFSWISLGVLIVCGLLYFLLVFLNVMGSMWGRHW